MPCEEGATFKDCTKGEATGGLITAESTWATLRLDFIIVVALLRVLTLRPYIQSFLTCVLVPMCSPTRVVAPHPAESRTDAHPRGCVALTGCAGPPSLVRSSTL